MADGDPINYLNSADKHAFEEDAGDPQITYRRVKVRNTAAEPVPVNVVSTVSTVSTTTPINGTANTTPTLFPSVAGDFLQEVLIDNLSLTETIEISIDGGTLYKKIGPEGHLIWNFKKAFKQITIKTTSGTAAFESWLNREP